MTNIKIYAISTSDGEDAIIVDYDIKQNKKLVGKELELKLIGRVEAADNEFSDLDIIVKTKTSMQFDIVSFGTICIAEQVKEKISQVEANHWFIHLKINGRPFYGFRARAIDCLDRGRSEIEYYDDARTRLMSIDRYVFDTSRLSNVLFFRVPEDDVNVFCTEAGKNFIEENEFQGFLFVDTSDPNALI